MGSLAQVVTVRVTIDVNAMTPAPPAQKVTRIYEIFVNNSAARLDRRVAAQGGQHVANGKRLAPPIGPAHFSHLNFRVPVQPREA